MEVRRLPQLDADNRAFWTRGALGELAICRCSECRTWIHPHSAACFRCGGTALAFEAVSGYGTVVSFSVNHQAWVPGQVVPFAMAVVELDEQPGLWLTTNIVGCEPAQVRIGQRVRVRFEQHDDVWLPMFEPAA